MAIHPLWAQYPDIQKELEQTQKTIQHAIKIRNQDIQTVLSQFFESGGKLLRPAFFILFTEFGTVPSQKRKHEYAAALEILHAATLIHDDVIDDSPLRRDMPSIQVLYGKDIAVYTGDFLFTVYFQLLASAVQEMDTLDFNAKNMRKILVGELDQMHLKHNIDITVKQYLRHVKGKTAQLFQLSCVEGARFAGCTKRQQLLALRIGYNIGMGFQILDDILDYTATESELKKPVLEDLKNGHYTLPLILAMNRNRQAFAFLEKGTDLTDDDIQQAVTLIQCYQGVEQAIVLAERYTETALKEIKKLPDIPARHILYDVTATLLKRRD